MVSLVIFIDDRGPCLLVLVVLASIAGIIGIVVETGTALLALALVREKDQNTTQEQTSPAAATPDPLTPDNEQQGQV